MSTVSWQLKNGQRSRTHAVGLGNTTACGKRIGRNNLVLGSSQNPTDEEKQKACLNHYAEPSFYAVLDEKGPTQTHRSGARALQ